MNIAIVGASNDRSKFGNKAVRAYADRGHTVFPVNLRERFIEGIETFRSVLDIPLPIDRVSIYVPPEVTMIVLDDVARKGAAELFLNPGSENDAVIEKAVRLGLNPIRACSLLDIGVAPSEYS